MIIKEIQGLRSFAVILILFLFYGIPNFELGYLGVDIFFIMKMASSLKNNFKLIETKRFSIKEYFKRRILRLFPALFITLLL